LKTVLGLPQGLYKHAYEVVTSTLLRAHASDLAHGKRAVDREVIKARFVQIFAAFVPAPLLCREDVEPAQPAFAARLHRLFARLLRNTLSMPNRLARRMFHQTISRTPDVR
jgi:hypothetical protein